MNKFWKWLISCFQEEKEAKLLKVYPIILRYKAAYLNGPLSGKIAEIQEYFNSRKDAQRFLRLIKGYEMSDIFGYNFFPYGFYIEELQCP